jgi:hypothetical protein
MQELGTRRSSQEEWLGMPTDTTVLALKSVYDLNGKKAALKFISDDISMLAYKKARGNYHHLAGQYLSFCVYDLRYWYTKLARAR